jgi:hypothetical protein
MVEGTVEHVSADAADGGSSPNAERRAQQEPPLVYKALVALNSMRLEMDGETFALAAGMQTNAEILLSVVRSDAIRWSTTLRMGGLVSAIPHIASAVLMSNGMRAHDAGRVAHIH